MNLRRGGSLTLERGRASASLADVRVLDGRDGEERMVLPVDVRAVHDAALLTARKYRWVLNDALAEFARRTLHHPDTWIAVQAIAQDLGRF